MPPIGWPTAREIDASIKRKTYDTARYTGRKFCPLVTKMAQKVEWWEIWGPLGKTQASALDVAPNPAKFPKRIKKSFEPGYFREKMIITEADILMIAMLADEFKLEGINGLVASAIDTLNTRKDNLIEWSIWQAYVYGQVAIDENGVKFTATYGVPAANLNKHCSVAWATSDTATPVKDLLAARLWFEGTGYRMKYIKMSEKTLQDLINAKDTKQYYAGVTLKEKLTPANVQTWGPQLIPDTEWEIVDFGYATDAGVYTAFMPDDFVMISGDAAPGEMMDWCSVPSLQNGIPVAGPFAVPDYKHLTDYPPKVEIFGGIFGLPRIKIPNIIFKLDTAHTS